MNIYYAPPERIANGFIELQGQESRHAHKVMRVREGDSLTVVDGKGGRYAGPVARITKKIVQVKIEEEEQFPPPEPQLILGMGVIKKRDRLEFAVEKAVELGVSEICLFRSRHTVKQNVRMDRLESTARSAMKQSLRTWLPEISFSPSFEHLLEAYSDIPAYIAHEKVESGELPEHKNGGRILLLVGPEGGFAEEEVTMALRGGAQAISLGKRRLRAETAAVVIVSGFSVE